MTMPMLRPNTARLVASLEALAQIVEPDTPGWTRRFPSPAYLAGREWLREQLAAAGLATSVDAGANLLGRQAGSEDLPPIMVGSHSDTVLGGGRYDGPLGVLGALEAARSLREAGVVLRHPLVVADYLAEEVNGFGVSCIGSRAIAGSLDPEWLSRSFAGQTLAEAISAAGGSPAALGAPLLAAGELAACLELHIEQGPVLIGCGARLGAVSGIVGIRRGTIELIGQPDHAGTTPMELRHDALAAAAAVVSILESLCRAAPGAVGTVGRLEVQPNQGNVVPGRVLFAAEIRSLDAALTERLWSTLLDAARGACAERGVTLRLVTETNVAPAAPPPWLLDALLGVCRELDPAALLLPSGAGHDTGHLARVAPSAMIFVPSIGGRSHCPQEATDPADLTLGVRALAQAILTLDATL